MGELEDALESWDGTSDPPEVIVDHMRSTNPTDLIANEKIKNYLTAEDQAHHQD